MNKINDIKLQPYLESKLRNLYGFIWENASSEENHELVRGYLDDLLVGVYKSGVEYGETIHPATKVEEIKFKKREL